MATSCVHFIEHKDTARRTECVSEQYASLAVETTVYQNRYRPLNGTDYVSNLPLSHTAKTDSAGKHGPQSDLL